MRTALAFRTRKAPRGKSSRARLRADIRELKTRASAVVGDVQRRHVTNGVTKRGKVQALIVPRAQEND